MINVRELQPFFDHLLLIPGREMTTFHGHFNVFGVTQFMDWRISKGGLDLNAVLRDARSKGGIASVNHAEAPGGEECMGCRWTPAADTDMSLFSAVEVINYGDIMFSSAKYWDSQLRAGHRLAAVGGSDNHNATTPSGEVGAIGWPTTAVEADELSVPAILDGIRAGRTFIDLTASRDKMLDFEADAGGASAKMGGTLHMLRPELRFPCAFRRLRPRDRWFTCCWTVRNPRAPLPVGRLDGHRLVPCNRRTALAAPGGTRLDGRQRVD